ncbi:hypothetical protein SAMN05444695_10594 [Rhodococcus triatomae]|uniref:Lipoprotein n=1 Tax=Rhodococcus triatomae TaxID=300028 RepID=A0A1G8HX92_9NOCA|nr:hypothetical protein SAMN05444695_10594 [Rhodococcus triatomae]
MRRKSRTATDRIGVVSVAAALALLVAGCEGDGQSGIPTDPPATEETTTTEPTTTRPSTTPPTTTRRAAPVDVGEVPGNPAAAAALQAWADDLVSTDIESMIETCWTLAPSLVRTMYADPESVAAVVARPGMDGQYAVSWTDGTTRVSAKRSEIASGYACPHVHPEGTVDYYTLDDAEYAARRFLARAVGDPVDRADREAAYPLICPGNSPWDPRGTGAGGQPPLKLDASALDDVSDFAPDRLRATRLASGYVTVTAPVTVDGDELTRQILLAVGPDGYCLGEVED